MSTVTSRVKSIMLLCLYYLVMSFWTLGSNFRYKHIEAYLLDFFHNIYSYFFFLLTGISLIELGQEYIDKELQWPPVSNTASTSEIKFVTWSNYLTVSKFYGYVVLLQLSASTKLHGTSSLSVWKMFSCLWKFHGLAKQFYQYHQKRCNWTLIICHLN
jgi:hypothetical protein